MPVKTHPDAVGRGLALGVLDRNEWPRWLMSDDKLDLRLFDLEFIGPFLYWPPQRTSFRDYREGTNGMLEYARQKAYEAGILEFFASNLERLKKLNFSRVIDFSGHPHAETMKRVIVRGLEVRQRELRRSSMA